MKKLLATAAIVLVSALALLYRPSVSLERLKEKYTDEASRFVETGGMTAHYRVTGEGPPVLLVHGTSSSLHTWSHWHDHLSQYFTVYSVDLPGCGLTGPHPADDYSIAAYLEFLDSFTSGLSLDTFYIAGNSLGGHIAWEYAAVSPRIRKVVLVDPSGFHMQDREVPLVFKLGSKKIFSAFVEVLNVKPLVVRSLKEVYHNDDLVTRELRQRYSDLIRRKGNRRAFVNKVAQAELSDASELRGVNVPVLIEWGAEDTWIPLKLSAVFTENLPNSELVVYDACGHVPQEELPERSARDAIDFLLE